MLLDLRFREVPRQLHEILLLLLRLLAPACPPLERQSDAFLLRRIPRISRIGEDKDIGLTTHVQTASSATERKGLYLQLFGPLDRERRGHFTIEVRNCESDLAVGQGTRRFKDSFRKLSTRSVQPQKTGM